MKSNDSILITGGTGAIGSFAVRHFVENGYRPLVVDIKNNFSLLNDIKQKFEFVSADILDYSTLVRVVKKKDPSCIVHLAAALVPLAEENPPVAWRVNVDGTLNVLEAARTFGVNRVVFASSKGALGRFTGKYGNPTYHPITEDYPFNPQTVYGATKVANEVIGRQYERLYGIKAVALRFGETYGPGKIERHGAVGLVSRIIETALAGREFSLKRGGDQANDFTYNRDIGLGVFLAATKKDLSHSVFHIGSGRLTRFREIVEALEELCGPTKIRIGPGLEENTAKQQNSGVYDITRARKELGYSPKYDIRKAVMDYRDMLAKLNLRPLGAE